MPRCCECNEAFNHKQGKFIDSDEFICELCSGDLEEISSELTACPQCGDESEQYTLSGSCPECGRGDG